MNLPAVVNVPDAFFSLKAPGPVIINKLCKANTGQRVHDKWSYYCT